MPKESYRKDEIEQMKRGEFVLKQARNAEIDAFNEKIDMLCDHADYCIDVSEGVIRELENYEQTKESIDRIQSDLECYDGTINAILQSGLFSEKYSEYWKRYMDEIRTAVMNLIKKIRENLNIKVKVYEPYRVFNLDELIADADKRKQEIVSSATKIRGER